MTLQLLASKKVACWFASQLLSSREIGYVLFLCLFVQPYGSFFLKESLARQKLVRAIDTMSSIEIRKSFFYLAQF
jgi:hypothetical protein